MREVISINGKRLPDALPLFDASLTASCVLWAVVPFCHHTDILTMYPRSRPGWLSNSQLLLGGRSPVHHNTPLVHKERPRISSRCRSSGLTRRRRMFTTRGRHDSFELALANHGRPSSFTASSTASRYVTDIPLVNVEPPADTDDPQPDGYLTEERKQADPDHGFSTFFSETGAFFPLVRPAAENM